MWSLLIAHVANITHYHHYHQSAQWPILYVILYVLKTNNTYYNEHTYEYSMYDFHNKITFILATEMKVFIILFTYPFQKKIKKIYETNATQGKIRCKHLHMYGINNHIYSTTINISPKLKENAERVSNQRFPLIQQFLIFRDATVKHITFLSI